MLSDLADKKETSFFKVQIIVFFSKGLIKKMLNYIKIILRDFAEEKKPVLTTKKQNFLKSKNPPYQMG